MFSEFPGDDKPMDAAHTAPTQDSRWAVIVGAACEMPGTESNWISGTLPFGFQSSSPRDLLFHVGLQRLRAVASPHRTIAVATREHGAAADAVHRIGGQRLTEPADRGSAASVFLAASYILEYDPKATMLLHPASYAAFPEERLQAYLLRLCLLAELFHDQIVVLGAAPVGTERDYSWVMPGGVKSPSLWVGAGPNPLGMVTYHERPNGEEAQRLFQEGALLNTGICAVKVKSLWKLGWETMPEAMRHFDAFRQVMHGIKNDANSPRDEGPALQHLYSRIPCIDMSCDLLQRASQHLTVLPMDDVSWSDTRDRERMQEILHREFASGRVQRELAAQEH